MHHLIVTACILTLQGPAAQTAPPITAAAFSTDGKFFVLGSQAGIEIRSWPDLKLAKRIKTDLDHVHDLAFSPDGKTLLAAGGSPAELGAVQMLRWPDLKPIARVAGHRDLIYRVAWSADGKRWATASGDNFCRVFAADTHKQLAVYEGHSRPVLAIAFLPDGKSIVAAGVDQTLQVWDAATGKTKRILDNHVAAVNDLAVRPGPQADSGPMIVSVSEDRTVRLWQPNTGRLVRFTRLKSPPRVVAWSPDGTRLLVGCNDGQLRVIDPDTLEILSDQPGLTGRIHALAAHPNAPAVILGGAGFAKKTWK